MKYSIICTITTIFGAASAAPIFEWDPNSIAYQGGWKRAAIAEAQRFPRIGGGVTCMALQCTHSELYRPFNSKLGQRSADAKPVFEWDPNSILYTGPEKRNAQQLSPNVRLDGDDVIA